MFLNCKGSPACTIYAGANTMDSGFPLDWFCELPSSDVICEICGKVLNSPRATGCGHSFCQRCLEFWIEYYGICPKRCGEIDLESLKKESRLEKKVMSLLVTCKYSRNGCKVQITLAEKQKHEMKCSYKPKTDKSPLNHTTDRKTSVGSQDTYVEMASGVACKPPPSHDVSSGAHLHPSAFAVGLAYYTYHLKRRSPGESFGFILVAGAKNSNGKAVNFSIKTVSPGTVAAEVGLLTGDKILQVDNIGLSQLAQQEAVSRIKDNPEVILTVLRAKRNSLEHHVYEDILYSDIPSNQEQKHNFRERISSTGRDMLRRKKSEPLPERIHLMPSSTHVVYKSPTQTTVCSDPTRSHLSSSKLLAEKVSADSGLSSSTSSFSPPDVSKDRTRRHTDAKHEASSRKHHKDKRGSNGTEQSSLSHSMRVEGEYEVEEIFLQKNGTNQLGITLGYDTTNSAGSLYVCEVISSGLAAKDGRIRKGDTIRKVNGFEVYDPEEAVLLFLEQDQDISLTVARKVKVSSRHHQHRRDLMSRSQSSLHYLPLNLIELYNEDKLIRRTDSCGSLDSHSHRQNEEVTGGGGGGRRHSESAHLKRVISPVRRNPPSSSSIGSTGIETSSIGTDYVFQPIKEGRPSTVGPYPGGGSSYLMRSSTSIGSAPERHTVMQTPPRNQMTRHQSLEARRLRSTSPCKTPHSENYRPRDIISPRSHQIAPSAMYRSVSTFRCESLV